MKIECDSCEKEINIPDEKVPKDQAFNLTCPQCKNKIRVDQHLKAEEPEEAPAEDEDTVNMFQFVASDDFEEDEVLEIYEEDDQVALVLDQENEDFWINALSELNFKLQTAKSPDHAVHKLKFTDFDLVVLNAEYTGVNFKESPVYDYMIHLPMSQRRRIFFVLVGDEFRTTNNMEAFALSANVVINSKDFEKAGLILRKTITDNDNFYKVYKDTLKAHGKV